MDARKRLIDINRLISDVYEKDTRISALLTAELEAEEIEQIKADALDEFIRLFVYGIRCRFVGIVDGMRRYTILAMRYGLEEASPATLLKISEEEGVSPERIRQLEEKALSRLKPTARHDVLRQIAALAAREALDIDRVPVWMETEVEPQPKREPAAVALTPEALSAIEVTEDAVTMKTLHQRINEAVGNVRGQPGHIKLSALRNGLIRHGYLMMALEQNGKESARPTDRGMEIGIDVSEREGMYGLYRTTVYTRRAQEFIRDNLISLIW